MSEIAQRTPTPPGVLVPVPDLARTHSGPGPRPAEGPGAAAAQVDVAWLEMPLGARMRPCHRAALTLHGHWR